MGKSKKSAISVPVPSLAASGLDKKKGKRGLDVASTLVSATKKQKPAERPILPLKKVSPEQTSESEEEQAPKVLVGKKGGLKTKALGKKAPAPESSEDESSDEPLKLASKKEVTTRGKVGKGIVQLKNVKPTPADSSDEDSDSSGEDSESEDVKPSKPTFKKQPAVVQKPPVKESSDESSDDSESEEEIKNTGKAAGKPVKNMSKKKESSTDDSSDSDNEEEPTIKLVKDAGKPAVKPLSKKAESSDSDSSEESDDESDEEPQIKKNKFVPTTKVVKAAVKPVAKPLLKKAESSDEDSSEESDDESDEEPPVKKKKIVPAVKAPAKKVETSDEDDSSEESEEEDSGKELDNKKQKISGKAVVVPPSKKVESSDEDSSEESEEDSDEEPQIKKQKAAKKPVVKVPAKKEIIDEEDSSEEDSSEEDEDKDESDEEPRSKKQKMEAIMASGKVAANGKPQTNVEEETQEKKIKFKNQKKENANEDVTPGRGSGGDGLKTIFVKNLAWSLNEDTVAEFFQAVGEVKEVRLAMDGNQRPRGFGYVEFTTEAAAKKACEKSGESLAGREIYVDLAKDRPFSPSSGGKQDWNSPRSGSFGANDKRGGFRSGSDMTAFVRGFDKFQDEDSIRGCLQDFFSECGNIQGIRLPSDRETGRIKGFAYVEFSDKDALSKAVELNGAELNGRNLFIDAASQGSGGGGRGDGGGRGGRGGHVGGRGDFGGGRGRGGGGGRGGGWGGRGGGAPRQKINLAPTGTGKKTTFGDD